MSSFRSSSISQDDDSPPKSDKDEPVQQPEEDSLGLESFIRRLKKRAKDLDHRERDLNRREALLTQALGGATPSDVLHLNVGGCTDICVLRRTLTCIPDSMLAAKFSGRWDDTLEKDRHGNIFIDWDPPLFQSLISFLRKKSQWQQQQPHFSVSTRQRRPPAPPAPSADFDHLLEYYHLPLLEFYTIEITPCSDEGPIEYEISHPHSSPPSNSWSLSSPPTTSNSTLNGSSHSRHSNHNNNNWHHRFPYSISSPRFMSFSLQSVGHSRIIASFTVVFGRFSQLRIGWYSPTRTTTVGSSGIGHYSFSCALDVGNHQILCEGGSSSIATNTNGSSSVGNTNSNHPHHKLSNQEGTMVQFKQYRTKTTGSHTFWSWKVVGNAQDVDDYGDVSNSTSEYFNDESEDWSLVPKQNSGRKYHDPTPCISLQGNVYITDIEYEECVS